MYLFLARPPQTNTALPLYVRVIKYSLHDVFNGWIVLCHVDVPWSIGLVLFFGAPKFLLVFAVVDNTIMEFCSYVFMMVCNSFLVIN